MITGPYVERLRRDRTADSAPVPPRVYTSDVSFPRSRRYVGRMVDALDSALKTDAVSSHGGVLWLAPSD